MESLSTLNQEEKQKLLVYNAVSKVCDEVGSTNTYIGKFKVDSDAKVVITELIWKKMEQYADDLVAFSQHAKRNQINIEDVKLLFRRNEKISEELSKADEDEMDKPIEKVGKRKRTSTTDKTEELSKTADDEPEKTADKASKRKRTSTAAKAVKKS